MILTIALNPSVVRQLNISEFNIGELNTASSDELTVGDCGIYSAYVIKVMQGEPYVMGLSGGIGGRFIKNFLDKNRIKTNFLHVDHETKTLMIIRDKENITQISSHNEEISDKDFNNIKHKLNNHINETNIITLSGSDHYLPKILDEIHNMSKNRKKIILGAEGMALKSSVDKKIYCVVMSANDLKILGFDYPTDEFSYESIRKYLKIRRIKYLFIKNEYEITGFAKNKICRIKFHSKDSIYPIVKSMILGGVTIGVKRSYPFEKIMKLVGSIANACSIDEYPFVIKRKDIDRGIKQCKLHEIYNQRNGYDFGGRVRET